MNEIEFSALMVSRVCHDLVGPLGAICECHPSYLDNEVVEKMKASWLAPRP